MRSLEASDPTELGRYRTVAEIGRGGMGRVLLGSGPDGRLVAVKLVDEQYVDDQNFRARFRREVRASRKVAGAYTAAVIDADADAPVPWLASVYVPGPSLGHAVAVAGVLEEEAALRLAAGLATALIEVRRAGLVHRDLKPSNVLLTEDGLRVIDFGIARAIEVDGGTQVTRTGGVVGTPRFMSPEQALGRELTTAGDIFSLGSVLVYACTGRGPFDGGNTPRTLHNVVHADPVLGDLPGRVREVVLSCLHKDPSTRPTPERLLESIRLGPAARPWPAGVHRLIAEQHAEVERLLPGAPQQPYEPPTVVDPPSGPSPGTGAGLVTRRHALVGGGVLVGLAAVGGAVAWATSGDDKSARKGGSAGSRLLAVLSGSPGTVMDVLYTPDGQLLATTCADGTVRLWDMAARRLSGEPIRVTDDDSPAVTFSRTGDVLATASKDGVKLWDMSSRQQLGKTLTVAFADFLDSPGPVIDVGYSPDGDTLAGAGSSILQLWDARSRRPIGRLNLGGPDLLVKINFSGDGRTLALPDDQTIRLWDVASRKEVGTALLGHTAAISTAVMSPDGRTLATGAWDTTVRLWGIPDRRPIGQPLRGHSHVIQGLAFSPDGRTLASGCADGTARLWDVAGQRALGPPIKANTRSVTGVSFDLVGHTLAIGADKTVQLWDVSGRVPA